MGMNYENMDPLPIVEDHKKFYARRGGLGTKKEVIALQGVSFSILPDFTLGLVGESGSGKSTLAFCLACMERPTSGRIVFQGDEITAFDEKQLRALRPRIQLVFQDPARSLNPRFSGLDLVSEPLLVQGRLNKRERDDRARALLAQVGLPEEKALRRADEFSGGHKKKTRTAPAPAAGGQVLVLRDEIFPPDFFFPAQITTMFLSISHCVSLA